MANSDYALPTDLAQMIGPIANLSTDPNDPTRALLQRLINGAAYMIDYATRKPPRGQVAFTESASSTRYYDDPDGGRFWWVGNILHIGGGTWKIDDLLSVSSIKRGTLVLTATDYKLRPYNEYPKTEIVLVEFRFPADLTGYRTPQWGTGVAQIEVTGTWGFCSLANRPDVIKNATLMIAANLYARMSMKALDVVEVIKFMSKDLASLTSLPLKEIAPEAMASLQAAGLVKDEDADTEIAI